MVALTFPLSKRIPQEESKPTPKIGATIPLSPYEYRREPDFTNSKIPNYSVKDFLERGYQLRRQGNYRKAEDILKTGLLFDPDNSETLKAIGQLAFLDGRYEEAINYFMQCLALKPDTVGSYSNLAVSLFCAENLDYAEAIASKGLALPDGASSGQLNFIMACIKHSRGEIDEVEQYLEDAVQLLGVDIQTLLHSSWASPLKDLPAYQSIQERVNTELNSPPHDDESGNIAPVANE